MNTNNKSFDRYDSGIEFWNDTVLSKGINNAFDICSSYLDTQLKSELSNDEKRFCRELFTAMYMAEMNKLNPNNLIYPYNFKKANDREEASYYHKSKERNQACAIAIDKAIIKSGYKSDYCNLELAAMLAISGYGFERVRAVLAHHIKNHHYDGRYSTANKNWVKGFTLDDNVFTFLNSHAILVDDFATYTRKLHTDLGADRLTLAGDKEHGEFVRGYEITHSIMIDKNQGYVIGHNPNAVSHYVCWQFYIRDGKRDYNWGIYGEEQDAVNAYIARVFVAFN